MGIHRGLTLRIDALEEAECNRMLIISQELGHFRPAIVMTYFR